MTTPADPSSRPRIARPHRYRGLLLTLLAQCSGPVSAQTLHAMARGQGTAVGVSTVYRELRLLAEEGRVRPVRIDSETLYQVSDRDLLVCDSCGRLQQLEHRLRRAEISDVAGRFFGTSPIVIHGRCRDCTRSADMAG